MAGGRPKDMDKDEKKRRLNAFLDESVRLARDKNIFHDRERFREEEDRFSEDSLAGGPVSTGAEIEDDNAFRLVGGGRPRKADEFSLAGSAFPESHKQEDDRKDSTGSVSEKKESVVIASIQMHQILQAEYGSADWANRIYGKAPLQRAMLSGSNASRVGIHVGGKEFLPYTTRPHVNLDSTVPMDMNNRLMDGVKTVQRGFDAGFDLNKVVAHLVTIKDPVVRQGGIDMINTLKKMDEASGGLYPGSLTLTEEDYEALHCDSRTGKVIGLSSEVDKVLQEERKREMGEFKKGENKKINPQFKAWLTDNQVLPQMTENCHKRRQNEGSEIPLARREEARGFDRRAESQRAGRGSADISDAGTEDKNEEQGFSISAKLRPGR